MNDMLTKKTACLSETNLGVRNLVSRGDFEHKCYRTGNHSHNQNNNQHPLTLTLNSFPTHH